MKTVVPDYYFEFKCIADKCRHTCCEGWEVDIDGEKLERYLADDFIAPHIDKTGTPHFRLDERERCPFLDKSGLCELIVKYGEESLCQICRDHPRFRNFWSNRVEIGLGLVCEEAGRIILGREKPMTLVILSDDGKETEMPEDEEWLTAVRERLLGEITETGERARLKEYLIFRHLADALYDGRVEERLKFIERSYREIIDAWSMTDGSLSALVECARKWSYDVEYDDEEMERRLSIPE